MFIDNISTSEVEALFPLGARANVRRNWPEVKRQLKALGITEKSLVLYALGTILAENAKFTSAPERSSTHSQSLDKAGYQGIQDPGTIRPYGAYDSTMRVSKSRVIINKHLGNAFYPGKDENLMRSRHGMPLTEDLNHGEKYRGRGYIQLTGKYNYEVMQKRVGKRLGLDLVSDPEAAEDPTIAAKILAQFIFMRRDQISVAMRGRDYKAARRAVNSGGLHWEKIRNLVGAYEVLEAEKEKREAEKSRKATLSPWPPKAIVRPQP